MGGPYNPLNITIIPDCNSATSSYPSWAVLENELGVTLPRDPINQQGGLAFHPGRYFNYLYYSRTAAQGARCPQGQWYVLYYRLERGDAMGDERIGVTRCDNGQKFYAPGSHSNGAITVGMSPAI